MVMLEDIPCFLCCSMKRGFSVSNKGNIYQVCKRVLHADNESPSGIAARVPLPSSLFLTMTEKGSADGNRTVNNPKNGIFFIGKIPVRAWQEFQKTVGNRALYKRGVRAGGGFSTMSPPFLKPHTSRLQKTIFFLFIYIDHLTCEKKKRCESMGLRK